MAENYNEKCGSCRYTDLKEQSFGKMYCTKHRVYNLATTDVSRYSGNHCSDYQRGHTDDEVERARR